MVVSPDGAASGSVSGGCVEGAVYELGNEVIADGVARLERYGVSDDDAFAVGLTCGGILDVFVEPVSRRTFPELADVAADIDEHRPVAVATVITHPDTAWVGRRIVVHRGGVGEPRFAARRRGRDRRRAGTAGDRPQRGADLRPRRGTPR